MQDWEDIESGSCDEGHCLYVADIGDNDAARADVVIYDRLAPAELLNEAPEHAELINAGKAQHDHTLKQDEMLYEAKRAGRNRVRI